MNKICCVASALFLASCSQEPDKNRSVDTSLAASGTSEAIQKPENAVAPTAAAIVPTVTEAWLVGSWAPAEMIAKNDPTAPCETDIVVGFSADGTYSDGASEGRFSTDGKTIRYYNRKSVYDLSADPDVPFSPKPLEDIVNKIRALDRTTFRENGENWRRCV